MLVTGLLRTLAIVVLVASILACAGGIHAARNDEVFYRAAAALERHSADIPFQIEYYQALGQHAVYLVGALLSGVVGVITSVVLFALAAILARLRRLEDTAAR